MKLKELLTGISVLECTADPELEIKEIFYDSRKVTPGSLFVAVSGFAAAIGPMQTRSCAQFPQYPP